MFKTFVAEFCQDEDQGDIAGSVECKAMEEGSVISILSSVCESPSRVVKLQAGPLQTHEGSALQHKVIEVSSSSERESIVIYLLD